MARRFCEQCGEPLGPNARFCPGCGESVTGTIQPSPQLEPRSSSTPAPPRFALRLFLGGIFDFIFLPSDKHTSSGTFWSTFARLSMILIGGFSLFVVVVLFFADWRWIIKKAGFITMWLIILASPIIGGVLGNKIYKKLKGGKGKNPNHQTLISPLSPSTTLVLVPGLRRRTPSPTTTACPGTRLVPSPPHSRCLH